jgi:hypothetical protein
MFDNIQHKTQSTVVAVTRVVEKTISPDKVSEMYDSIREEVESNLIRQHHIKSDKINGVIAQFKHNACTSQRVLKTRFIINGEEVLLTDLVQSGEDLSEGEMYEVFRNHYARSVSDVLLKDVAIKLLQ